MSSGSGFRNTLTAFKPGTFRSLLVESCAAVVAAMILVAYAVSFAAILFQGDLSGGFAIGLWSLLMTVMVACTYVNLTTSIPPIGAGPDTPMIAVATLLAVSVATAVMARGGTAETAVVHVLLSFSIMTVIAGLAMYLLGSLNVAEALRFIPYPVIAGFLAATGALMLAASYKVVTGATVTQAFTDSSVPLRYLPQLAIALGLAGLLLSIRRYFTGQYVMPIIFFGAAAALDAVLWSSSADSGQWFITGVHNLQPWWPYAAAASGTIDWIVILQATPEMIACAAVGIISLLVKISSLEVSRSSPADFNQEFRSTGGGSLIAVALGGMAGSVLLGATKALTESGARTRFAGVAVAVLIAGIVLAGVNLPGYVPKPILAGFLVFLGYTMLVDALKSAFGQKSWIEFILAVAIAVTCLYLGYIAGVVAGLICACLIFAVSYGRIGVVRRNLSRAVFAGSIERAASVEHHLRKEGDAIQIYWLSGYIFFGSAETLFDALRRSLAARAPAQARYVILEFAGVTGIDSSAVASFVKLKNFVQKQGITVVYCGLAPSIKAAFEHAKLIGGANAGQAFPDVNEALAWCEERILLQSDTASGAEPDDFARWLSAEIGCTVTPEFVNAHFDRKQYQTDEVIYRQGEAADTLDFVAIGTVALIRDHDLSTRRTVRRSMRQTVMGEMGFFRQQPRVVTIAAQENTQVYSVSRQGLTRIRQSRPDVYEAFLTYVIRTLSDRLEFAHKEIAALT